MNTKESYHYCKQIARAKAKNFYYSFIFLPRNKKEAMSAVYAFMRTCDDITDNDKNLEYKKSDLNSWNIKIHDLLKGSDFSHPLFPALYDTIQKFHIPKRYFTEVIEGVEMDLAPRRFEHFEELYTYCYKVASVVGLVCLHIFGFKDEAALQYGESLGIAFQLTNILRDLKEDARMGRVYLPQEDFRRFGYMEKDLLDLKRNDSFYKLMEFEVQRAEDFYQKAAPLFSMIDPDSRKALRVMTSIYHGILNKIRRRGFDTLSRRIHLGFWEKIKLGFRS